MRSLEKVKIESCEERGKITDGRGHHTMPEEGRLGRGQGTETGKKK